MDLRDLIERARHWPIHQPVAGIEHLPEEEQRAREIMRLHFVLSGTLGKLGDMLRLYSSSKYLPEEGLFEVLRRLLTGTVLLANVVGISADQLLEQCDPNYIPPELDPVSTD